MQPTWYRTIQGSENQTLVPPSTDTRQTQNTPSIAHPSSLSRLFSSAALTSAAIPISPCALSPPFPSPFPSVPNHSFLSLPTFRYRNPNPNPSHGGSSTLPFSRSLNADNDGSLHCPFSFRGEGDRTTGGNRWRYSGVWRVIVELGVGSVIVGLAGEAEMADSSAG